MALSTCIKCGNNHFEMVEQEPEGSIFKYNFIQCSVCGGVVGVQDVYNIGNILNKIRKRLDMEID